MSFSIDPGQDLFIDPWVLGQIRQFLESDPPRTSIQRLTGRSLVVADPDYIQTEEATTSTTYTDLATVGPQQNTLPPGKYVFFWGACVNLLSAPGPSARAEMSLSINGAAPTGTPKTSTQGDLSVGASMVQLLALTADSNDVKVQYLTNNSAHDGNFACRYLASLRYSD